MIALRSKDIDNSVITLQAKHIDKWAIALWTYYTEDSLKVLWTENIDDSDDCRKITMKTPGARLNKDNAINDRNKH